jgi:hypothetical protein
MPGLIDLIGKISRMMHKDASETFSQTTDSLEAISEAIAALIAAGIAVSGTVNDVGPAITDFNTDLTEASNDHYNGMLMMFLNGVCAGQAHLVDDYVGATKNCLFAAADQWTDIPADGDNFVLLPAVGAYLAKLYAALLVPGADSLNNVLTRDVAGDKSDTALYVATATASLMRYVKALLQGRVVGYGTFTTSSATVPADTSRTEANDYWKGHGLMPLTGTCAGQERPIRQYTVTTDVFTLDEPFTAAPGLVAYVILTEVYPVQRLLDIFNLDNSMLELNETGATITTDGTEQTAYINNIPAAAFKPLAVQLDLTPLAAGDSLRVREYYRNVAGGALVLHDEMTFVGAQAIPMKSVTLEPDRHGIQVTIQELAGAHNDIVVSVLMDS